MTFDPDGDVYLSYRRLFHALSSIGMKVPIGVARTTFPVWIHLKPEQADALSQLLEETDEQQQGRRPGRPQ